MPPKTLVVGLVQQACGDDRAANLAASIAGIRDLASHDAQLILLQELHTGPYFCQTENPELFDLAESIPGPTTEELGAVARELGVVLVASLFERRAPGLYHNTAVVLERDAHGPGLHRYHPGLLQLANDLGFRIRLCRPYRAQTKGKVDRFNRYLRESFYNPLLTRMKGTGLLIDCATANRLVRGWLSEEANVRVHATLNERPIDRWRLELEHLQPLPSRVLREEAPLLGHRLRPVPVESLQHPLSVYEAIREAYQ